MSSRTLRFVWWFPAVVASHGDARRLPRRHRIVPAGIAPELPVAAKVEDVLAGRDAALERAREYLAAAQRR